jgi:hypothetical protein
MYKTHLGVQINTMHQYVSKLPHMLFKFLQYANATSRFFIKFQVLIKKSNQFYTNIIIF